jgi:DNA-binding NarL/FixJ family response regulator
MSELKIGIVDDHLLFRRSMTFLINSFEGMQVVVDAENGKQCISKLITTPVDVLLLDIEMPIMDGYETCKLIKNKFPDIKILIVSQLSSRESIHKMMELDAHGYFTKNCNPDQLELALRNVHEEGFYFGLELGSVIKEAMLWEKNNSIPNVISKSLFSERELQIIQMICKEYKSKDIADKLFINVRTVETHRKNVMEKCNAKNIIGVILFALKNNIISIFEI